MTEIFLQTLENTIFEHLIDTRALSFYTRHVDEILIIWLHDNKPRQQNTI
jgi:hypothetical protein